jgi:hypothetical protein
VQGRLVAAGVQALQAELVHEADLQAAVVVGAGRRQLWRGDPAEVAALEVAADHPRECVQLQPSPVAAAAAAVVAAVVVAQEARLSVLQPFLVVAVVVVVEQAGRPSALLLEQMVLASPLPPPPPLQ